MTYYVSMVTNSAHSLYWIRIRVLLLVESSGTLSRVGLRTVSEMIMLDMSYWTEIDFSLHLSLISIATFYALRSEQICADCKQETVTHGWTLGLGKLVLSCLMSRQVAVSIQWMTSARYDGGIMVLYCEDRSMSEHWQNRICSGPASNKNLGKVLCVGRFAEHSSQAVALKTNCSLSRRWSAVSYNSQPCWPL